MAVQVYQKIPKIPDLGINVSAVPSLASKSKLIGAGAAYNEEFEKRSLTLRRTRNSQRRRSRERGRTLPYEAPKIEGRGFSSEHSERRLGQAFVVSEFV